MIPNNNLSVLPWYTSLAQQNARKWWIQGRVYPLYAQAGFVPPFQIIVPHMAVPDIASAYLYDANTDTQTANILSALTSSGLTAKQFAALDYDVIVFPGAFPIMARQANGRYYIRLEINSVYYYSEIYTIVNDMEPYLKITWWDAADFTMDAGTIVYTSPAFKNILYLQSDLAKPEYTFEEDGKERDGYFFPVKLISEKKYHFSFLASEYLLDVMRLIRLSDFVEVEYRGQKYSLDTFLITPQWEAQGDVAVVNAEFSTATVAKKLGVGYIRAQRGDFSDDFSNDFANQQ